MALGARRELETQGKRLALDLCGRGTCRAEIADSRSAPGFRERGAEQQCRPQ